MKAPPARPDWSRNLLSVGVTGTNGKTSTTHWIGAALARIQRPVALATTLGSFLDDTPVDVPKTWGGFLTTMRACLDGGGHFAALEMTSEALARGFAKSWPVQVAVFTNLTHDHLDAHGSPEHYLASKAQLFVHLEPGTSAILNGCDPASELLTQIIPPGVRVLRYGVPSRATPVLPLDVRATSVDVTWNGTTVSLEDVVGLGLPSRFTIQALGDVYAENALAAVLASVQAGVAPYDAVEAVGTCAAPPGRFEVIHRCPYVVVDYAHSPDALTRTLLAARRLCTGKLTVVFGAGGDRDRHKRGPMGKAATIADRVVLTSDNPRSEDPKRIIQAIRQGIGKRTGVEVVIDRATAIELAVRGAGPEDVVVVAGKGHEVVQIVGHEERPFSDVAVVRASLGAPTPHLRSDRSTSKARP